MAHHIEEPVRRINELGTNRYFEQMDRVRAQLDGPAQVVRQLREAIDSPARQIQKVYEDLNRALSPYDVGALLRGAAEAGRQVEVALRQGLPLNWRDLSFDEVESAQEMVVEHGIPIVWVPNTELTRAVVACSGQAEAQSLLSRERDTVLRDVEASLAQISEPRIASFTEMTRRAVAAADQGHPEAAQALASAVLSATLDQGLGFDRFGKVRDWAEAHRPDDADLRNYRTTLVLDLAARFVLGRGKEKPGYNRNKTLHTVSSDQYTDEHSLLSVMAVTGLLREIDERVIGSSAERGAEAA